MAIPEFWQTATTYLTTKDEILAKLITDYPTEILTNRGNPFQTLARAIVGQQISVPSADAVWSRLEAKLATVSPDEFLKLAEEDLKECGLSRQKRAYLTNIAIAFQEQILTPQQWQKMTDTEIIKQLITIKGVGQWTAEMFLIFYLNRPDIFPIADIGLINAIKNLYGKNLTKPEILNLSTQWQPYRTVATWYLWLSLDPVTVQY